MRRLYLPISLLRSAFYEVNDLALSLANTRKVNEKFCAPKDQSICRKRAVDSRVDCRPMT